MSVSCRRIGETILAKHRGLLQQDLSVAKVRSAHELVAQALYRVDPALRLYVFGSSAVYGFHEPHSDVDFVVLRPEDVEQGKAGDSTSQLAKALQTELLSKLSGGLRSSNQSWTVEEVKRARVPVVRVKTAHIDFDVTAFRRNGVRNSALLRRYFEQHPPSRWLSIAVKDWSKRVGMNGPLGYMTSYGFNLMVVYYLLHRNRYPSMTKIHRSVEEQVSPGDNRVEAAAPLLPPRLSFVDKDSFDVLTIDPIPTYLPLDEIAPEALGCEVLDFLDFYLDRFPTDTHLITLHTDQEVTKLQRNWTKTAEDLKKMQQEKVFYRLCIEDPYEVNLNVGRNVSSFKLDMMRKHFENGRKNALGLL